MPPVKVRLGASGQGRKWAKPYDPPGKGEHLGGGSMEALGAGNARGHPAKAGSGQGIGHATCSQSLVKPGLMARAPPYGQAKPSPRPSRSFLRLSATWARGPSGASESLLGQRWNLLSVQMRKPSGEWGSRSQDRGLICHSGLILCFFFLPRLWEDQVWDSLSPPSSLWPPPTRSLFYSCLHLNSFYHP